MAQPPRLRRSRRHVPRRRPGAGPVLGPVAGPVAGFVVLFVASAVLALDQVTKQLALTVVGDSETGSVGGVLRFDVTRNPGAAFSLGAGTDLTALFTAAAAVAVTAVAVLVWRKVRAATLLRPADVLVYGMFAGGVGGNLTDRLFRTPGPFVGHVVDFIEVGSWPTFNVADAAVVTSAVLYTLLSYRDGRTGR